MTPIRLTPRQKELLEQLPVQPRPLPPDLHPFDRTLQALERRGLACVFKREGAFFWQITDSGKEKRDGTAANG